MEVTKNHIEFVIGLTRDLGLPIGSPHEDMSLDTVADFAIELMRRATIHQYHATQDCNVGLSDDERRVDAANEDAIIAICKPYGITPIFQGDPRGVTVKLKVSSGRTNDFAAEGVCVPTLEREEYYELDEDTQTLLGEMEDAVEEEDEDNDDD